MEDLIILQFAKTLISHLKSNGFMNFLFDSIIEVAYRGLFSSIGSGFPEAEISADFFKCLLRWLHLPY